MAPGTSVMFVYNDAVYDARVRREAHALADAGWAVTVIALQPGGLPEREDFEGVSLVRVASEGIMPGTPSPFRERGGSRLTWLRGYWAALQRWVEAAAREARRIPGADHAVLHGHDLTGLMSARRAASRNGTRVVYDSHELFVAAGSAARLPAPARLLLRAYEDRLARGADAVITVNGAIGRVLERRFGKPATLVMNCPDVPPILPDRGASPLRTTLGLGGRKVILHHGGLARGRGIEQTIAAVADMAPDVALVLLGNGELVPEIREASEGRLRGRVFHHPAVPVAQLPAWVGGADLGVIAFQPVDQNNIYGTPNKLFEFLAAGVPVVVSDFPEMRGIVAEADAGKTCDPGSSASIREAAESLLFESPEAQHARSERAHGLAMTRYSWARQRDALLSVYESLQAVR